MSDKMLDLKLSLNDVNTVLSGLAELPAKHSYDLITKIKTQGEKQVMNSESVAPTSQELLQE